MNIILDANEARVLGPLIEKELTTPEYYPLSLNALVNACNQKSNRDPFMSLDDEAVQQALRTLEQKQLAGPADRMTGRVSKFEHRLQEAFNFTRHETAVLCELLLRGPQTPGELRSRASRLQNFDDLGVVQSTLQRLMNRESPLVKILPRQPGTKEARYAHLLCGDIEAQEAEAKAVTAGNSVIGNGIADERLARMEQEITELRTEVSDLKQQLASFRKQFE